MKLLAATVAALALAPAANASTADTKRAICTVFGRYCSQALRVSWCESRWSIYARNGQFENIFQMGRSERRRYGWHTVGSSPWVASRAAYRYFVASGYSWRPWTCQP